MFRLKILILTLTFTLIAGCGGGGSSLVVVKGILVDPFGARISSADADITIQGTGETTHPNSTGAFSLSAPPGTYILTGSLTLISAGIRLKGTRQITLVSEQVDVGEFALTDSNLESGWNSYRNGKFSQAKNYFESYLDHVRAAQADYGSASAYSALGWTRGAGLNSPGDAVNSFGKALDGWPGNTDALVGMAAAELGRMRSTGGFRFNQALSRITSAIDQTGNYSSDPTHDDISETDLRTFRAFINFLNGNGANARLEALEIENDVTIKGNDGSAGTLAIILALTN